MYLRFLLLVALAIPSLAAEKLPMTFDAVYDEKSDLAEGGRTQGLQWISDDRLAWPVTDAEENVTGWRVLDVKTKREAALFDPAQLEKALAAAGVAAPTAKRLARQSRYTFDDRGERALLTADGDLYLFTLAGTAAKRLTATAAEEKVPAFSPDGRKVSFVRDNDLWVLDVASGAERRLTDDGSNVILNGILDYVYMEEIYGRGGFRGHWWSPDSRKIAMLRLDESPVPSFTVVDDIPYHLELETFHYPKAGDPNPLPSLRILPVEGGATVEADLESYTPADLLIAGVSWKDDASAVALQLQNRVQTWLDLVTVDAVNGRARRLLRETTPAWVDVLGDPVWLSDGGFLWLSEKGGYQHIYRYPANGKEPKQITEGKWDVESIHGVDEAAGFVYFSSSERSPIAADTWRATLDGTGRELLTKREGSHTARFSPSMKWFADTWSDAVTPSEVRLHTAEGTELRQFVVEPRPALDRYRLSTPEFLRVKARDGFELEAMLIKPIDFDPAKKYPVFQALYAGPEAPQVRNRWFGQTSLFYQLLAAKGYVVWLCDNRTASSNGAASSWGLLGRFGASELRDIEDGVAWLASQPWVDPSRIAISGWSYGGFMVSYAMTHSDRFAAGIAGGSVTDWRDYDSIYTERYLGLPQNNPDGYRDSSPRFAADALKGRLLLIHGSMDDNVHPQNTLQFARELQLAGKQFDLMMYPKSRHGVREPALRRHLQRMMVDFLDRTIGTTK
ncbi:MAG TPA: S9 family peptidase [Thermoanaerobaculia bacterium]